MDIRAFSVAAAVELLLMSTRNSPRICLTKITQLMGSVLIHRIGADCKFTIYNGWGCPAGAVNSVTDVTAGSGEVCAVAGVYDGGVCPYCIKKSAVYSCA